MGPSEQGLESISSRLHLADRRVAMMWVLAANTKPTLPGTADHLVQWQLELESREI